MTAAELERIADELGLDVVGAAPAAPYEQTERAIRERRRRGLFADMRFTTIAPETSCHPELLVEGARTVISAALCYFAPGGEPGPGEGRLPRYAWGDLYAELRQALDVLGRRLGGDYRVLVDDNAHVDREAAARAGVGFYGKNTMLITRRHGSWVVLGSLVTTAAVEATPPLGLDCGSCTLCIEACPTGALDEPGVLDANRCLSWSTQRPGAIPESHRALLGDTVYGCDICQTACPWNRGVEKRRADQPVAGEPTIDLVAWLEADGSELLARYDRLYVPRRHPRYLRRNALVAFGNSGDPGDAAAIEPFLVGDDALLREHAEWALERLREKDASVIGATERFRQLERWIAWVRVGAVPFAVFQVAVSDYQAGYGVWAWLTVVVFAVGAFVLFALSRSGLRDRGHALLSLGALTFDSLVLASFTLLYAWQAGTPTRQLLYLAVVEAAVRYGIVGTMAMAFASIPVLAGFEELRGRTFAPHDFRFDYVTFQFGVEVILGLIVGWLVHRLAAERIVAEQRAAEAEKLRDELGRRADLLDAANRCARALSSSLDLDEAFAAFIRELAAVVEYERVAIIAVEGADSHTLASAGRNDAFFPAGTRVPLEGTVLAEVIATGQTIERADMDPPRYPEEEIFLNHGLRARVSAPVFSGVRPVGMLSVSRSQPQSFSRVDVELLTLLGRLVGGAVQNIRAYEAERATVEELRRLSALRADFVSLVSHELRSPMAAVIGSARTLQHRWRELTHEQRDAFIALIADETSRLAGLVGDVLDTSRIEAGTFSYSFSDVDVGLLLRDSVAVARIAQDEVSIALELAEPLPVLRGDAERLRQVVGNLVENATKYSLDGGKVEVRAWARNGVVNITVADHGPGIAPEHRKLIFEKFGRIAAGGAKPGTGLGLFIARSIAEAHGGGIEVDATDGGGATFKLTLPVSP